MSKYDPIPLEEIKEAQKRIADDIIRTPIIKLNVETPAEIYLKLETLQSIRSFKARPASNTIRQLNQEQLKNGVWTASSGNFSQGLASMAKKLGVKCTIYLSEDTPQSKIEKTEKLGAKVVKLPHEEYLMIYMTRSIEGAEGTFIHPSMDPVIMAGNGTIGLEIMEDMPDVDTVIVPWALGGLTCGVSSAVKAINSDVKVYAVQVESNSAYAGAFTAGEVTVDPWKHGVFPEMYDLAKRLIDGVLVVSEKEVAEAVKLLVEQNCVVSEMQGAWSCAAGLSGKAGDGKIVCVITGGNIDRDELVTILQGKSPDH